MLRRSVSCCVPNEMLCPGEPCPCAEAQERGRARRRTEESPEERGEGELSRSDLRQVELLGRSLSSNTLEDATPLEGRVLVLARCRDRQSNELNLAWRSAFFALSSGGVLRIFRSADDRSKWAELGTAGENLAKWRSAMSDAHVVSCVRRLPESEASSCRRAHRRPPYCGATRARCAALGPTPIERDEDDNESVETDSNCSTPGLATRDELIQKGCRAKLSAYDTFEVWLRNDIQNPNAKPVLKFAGTEHASDLLPLHSALLACSHHFLGPRQHAFSHPLLAQYSNNDDHRFRPSNPLPITTST